MKKPSLLRTVCIVFVFCAATAIASPAQIFTTLYSFCSQTNCADGAGVDAAPVQAADGNFYGTTCCGGAYGPGTIFKITPSGTLTTLYNFCSQKNCADGSYPYAGLLQATDGNFYGTTYRGGANDYGAVFRVTPSGTLTTLYSFCSQSNCADGTLPGAGLVQASDGNFYGTTSGAPVTQGTVFKITPSGTLTTLYSFCSQPNCSDGADPQAGLVQATDGNFYGTTVDGGTSGNCGFDGCGTVFKITPRGTLTTLHSFDGGDGYWPFAGLVQATDGNFYGTTYGGGHNSWGTVFKFTPSGTLTTLYGFCLYCADGFEPVAGLVQATDDDFYGTTSVGGAAGRGNCPEPYGKGCGTVFKITPSGTLTRLHSFEGADGWGPSAGLVQATDGNFYGTTSAGGAHNEGTVFRLVSERPCFSCPLQW